MINQKIEPAKNNNHQFPAPGKNKKLITNEFFTHETLKRPFLILYVLIAVIIPFISLFSVFSRGNPFIISFFLTYAIIALIPSIFLYKKFKRKQHGPQQGTYFNKIGEKDLKMPLKRSNLVDKIEKHINSQHPLTIITGVSGSGKSILIKQLLKKRLEGNHWIYREIEGFIDFKAKLGVLLEEIKIKDIDLERKKLMIIFDDFEDFLENAANDEKNRLTRQLRDLTKNDRIKIVLLVREEYYFNLNTFLEKLEPDVFKSTINITGIILDENNGDDKRILVSKLENVVDRECREYIVEEFETDEQVLPLEIEMVGFMLEDIAREQPGPIGKQDYLDKYGGRTGLMQRYFRRYLESTSNKDIATAILFILSTETRLRRSYSPGEIAGIAHQSNKEVKKVLDELLHSGIVRKKEINRFALAHSYLARRFYELSGILLDPVERDNMNYFCDSLAQDLKLNTLTEIPTRKTFSPLNIFFIIILALLTIRLFLPIFKLDPGFIRAAWLGLDPFAHIARQSKIIDFVYLAPFIISIITGWYVWNFYKNLILLIKEKKTLSSVIVVVIYFTFLITMIEPMTSFALICFSGFLIGLRVFISTGTRKEWAKEILRSLRQIGFMIMTWTLLGILFGIVFFLVISGNPTKSTGFFWWAKSVELVLAIYYFIQLLTASIEHANKKSGTIFMGSLDRIK